MPSVTYVFKAGRKKDLLNNIDRANDFFYGAKEFEKQNFETNIIEYKKDSEKKSKVLKIADRILVKISGYPFSMSKLLTNKNLKIFFNSDAVFLINESISFSFLPFAIILKLFRKVKINIFLMGISNLDKKRSGPSKTQKFLTSKLFKFSNNIYFLGNGEHRYAHNHYPKHSEKFKLAPFSVDYNFWNKSSNDESVKRNGILFVGNDGNRDFNLLLNIAKNISDIDFTFVTQKIDEHETLPSNITLIEGSLHEKKLSDFELGGLYSMCKMVILPLKNSLQPSGQSVAMQAMATKTPVLISKTMGFWNFEDFKDKKNIFFVEPNDLDNWIEKIRYLYQNVDLLFEVANNAENLILTKYNTENLFNLLFKDNFNLRK